MSRPISNRIASLLVLAALCMPVACATIRVGTLPAPPATAKLRVYIQPHSTMFEGKGKWGTPDEKFVASQLRLASRYLAETGIYDIVSPEDVLAVLGDQKPTRALMEENDWTLAREIGKALHADYVMVMERGVIGITHTQYFVNMLINVESGRKFGARYSFSKGWTVDGQVMRKIIHASYRDIFRSAKEDLLAAAVQKAGRIPASGKTSDAAPAPTVVPAPAKPQTPIAPAAEQKPEPRKEAEEEAKPADLPPVGQKQYKHAESANEPEQALEPPTSGERDWVKEFDAQKVLTQDADPTKGKGTRLVVYDLDAPEQYKPVALILTDALREELFRLNQFVLVNRENLEKVLQEMALQQTGLIDEKEAVKTGRGLAASQVVTGRLGLLGRTFVMQTKRIDVETFATLSLTSEKFRQGQEEEVLARMPEFALRLAGRR